MVASRVTGLPASPATDARTCCGPDVPSVQDPTRATPSVPLVALVADSLPPPLATSNVTTVPGAGCPESSRTSTAGGSATGCPAWADCGVSEAADIVAGVGGTITVKVTGTTCGEFVAPGETM